MIIDMDIKCTINMIVWKKIKGIINKLVLYYLLYIYSARFFFHIILVKKILIVET